MRARTLSALVAAAAFAATPALAAHGKAGLWQITIKADASGMMTPEQIAKMRAMGVKMPMADGVTMQHCMTAAEAAMDGPPPQIAGQKDCKIRNLKTIGQGFEADMVCSGARMQGTGHMKMSYISSGRYAGQVDMNIVIHGRSMKSSSSFDGRWVSASCGKVAH